MTTPDARFLRGTVWQYEFEIGATPKPAVIVSNNGRNCSRWRMLHVVRLTTAPKPPQDSIVQLMSNEFLKGCAICDDLVLVEKAHIGRQLGMLTPGTMRHIDEALKRVLALP